MELLDQLFLFIFRSLKEKCSKEIETVGRQFPAEEFKWREGPEGTLKLTFAQAVDMLVEDGVDRSTLDDIKWASSMRFTWRLLTPLPQHWEWEAPRKTRQAKIWYRLFHHWQVPGRITTILYNAGRQRSCKLFFCHQLVNHFRHACKILYRVYEEFFHLASASNHRPGLPLQVPRAYVWRLRKDIMYSWDVRRKLVRVYYPLSKLRHYIWHKVGGHAWIIVRQKWWWRGLHGSSLQPKRGQCPFEFQRLFFVSCVSIR